MQAANLTMVEPESAKVLSDDAVADDSVADDSVSDTVIKARLEALDALVLTMRPAVQADGGDLVVTSVDAKNGIVDVQLQGACSSCAISETTLRAGVERIMKKRLDWVKEVRGDVASIDPAQPVSIGKGSYVPRF